MYWKKTSFKLYSICIQNILRDWRTRIGNMEIEISQGRTSLYFANYQVILACDKDDVNNINTHGNINKRVKSVEKGSKVQIPSPSPSKSINRERYEKP